MEFPFLILLHVAFGIFWAGAAIGIGLFVVPSVLDAGPAGGAVMSGVVKRRLPTILTMSAVIVVLTGVRLYMLRFSTAWLTTPEGMVLSLGALLALGAFAMGVFVQRPTAVKLAALAEGIARAGTPPTAAESAEIRALQQKLRRVAAITAWHLIGAALLMSSHRLTIVL